MTQLNLLHKEINCHFYLTCTAPLCPKDMNADNSIWFPDEPVCRLRSTPEWVKKQKKITRLKKIERSNYFTVDLLNSIININNQLKGKEVSQPPSNEIIIRRQISRQKDRVKRAAASVNLRFDI
ncbi:MAG: hypothetical protein Q8P44_07590 [Dehalococcoidia bacterium]|nr:hypothetical protein [Dehalococcoidia bacterium]